MKPIGCYLLVLLYLTLPIESCLVVNQKDPPTCNCSSLAINSSIFNKELSDHPSFLTYHDLDMTKPIINTDGCTTTVYCEGDYDLIIFDEKADTVFGRYSADGLCDARTQTWQVAVDAGFQNFKRLYGMCAYFRGNNAECTPHKSTHTFFLAYSNDFDWRVIFEVRDLMENGDMSRQRSSYFTHYATVRFDQKTPAPIQYTTDWTVAHSYLSNNFPEESLSYPSEETGSDVLESVILKFLSNEDVPLCGASIFILMKRYPGPTDVEHSAIVDRLRKHNIHLYIFFSTTPYGTPDHFNLYELAAKTNGFLAYNYDELFYKMLKLLGVSILAKPYQIYAVNFEVFAGSGRLPLPPLNAPFDDGYLSELSFTFGDHILNDTSYVAVTWKTFGETDTVDSRTISDFYKKGNNYCGNYVALPENTYTVELEYQVFTPTTLMIRFYSKLPTTHWIPFDL